MICPNCQRENSADQAFCGGCGSRLQRQCPTCQRPAPPDHDFCGACGQRLGGPPLPAPRAPISAYTPRHLSQSILSHPSTLEGERKDVTVLFVDVMGSMELAQGIDPEEWHAILDRFFHILTAGVHRFEGTINQYTGDGVMALFGAPVAHEDHAQRACYAALHLVENLRVYAQELRRERGLDFVVRMGMNSGDVVVGRIGDDLRMDYTAQGYTVGIAARLLDVAESGSIYITHAVAERVRGLFQLEDLGDFRVKGAREPVRVYALRGAAAARTRYEAARERGLVRFLGRESELSLLEDRLNVTLRGRGRVIGIVGGPGIGKTRLCRELLARAAERGLPSSAGSALPHSKMIPFMPVLELLRGVFQLDTGASPAETRAQLERLVRPLGAGLEQSLPLLFEFFEVPDPARPAPPLTQVSSARSQLHRALSRLLESSAPHVLLLDDLHWLDSGSEGVLELIIEVAERAPLLLLLCFRREYEARWMEEPHYERLPLAPLGNAASRELVRELLGEEQASEGITRAVLSRTSGNPFFIEELVRTLRESGNLRRLDEIALPSSIQSLIAARIDQLEVKGKTILQAASVVGQHFSAELVARVVELPGEEVSAVLRGLEERGFLDAEDEPAPDLSFCFRYPLMQEVAYRSQLGERRQRTHRRVAEALESAQGDAGEVIAAALAHHWEHAGELLRAARWYARAAEEALGKDPAESARHWLGVRVLLGRAEPSADRSRLQLEACVQILELGWALELGPEAMTEVFASGQGYAAELGDRRVLADLNRGFAFQALLSGSLDDASRCFEDAIELSGEDVAQISALRTWQAMAHIYGGRLMLAIAGLEVITAPLRDEPALPPLGAATASPARVRRPVLAAQPDVWALVMLGLGRTYAGQFPQARHAVETLAKVAAGSGSRSLVGVQHNVEAVLAWYLGDMEVAEAHARAGVEVFEGLGRPREAVFSLLQLGATECFRGQYSRAVEALERAHELARGGPSEISETEILVQLVHAYIGLGETTWALSLARHAVEVAQQRCARLLEGEALLSLARALRHARGFGELSAIERSLDAAQASMRQAGALAKQPFVHLERAALSRALGQGERRRQELEHAQRAFSAVGAVEHALRVGRLLATR